MAAASENITSWLDWDDHLLDFLLFGWIGWAALVVLVVNSVLTFFEPLQPQREWARTNKEGVSGAKVVAATGGAESCQWLNSALNWFYLHYDKFPEFVDAWVKALNEQSVKLGGPVQIKFERVKSGSLPPKFSEVTFEAGPDDKYVVHCKTDSRDISLAVFASQQTAEGVKLTNLTTNILRLKGTLKMKCFREGRDMMVNVGFEGRPDVKVIGKPVNPYQDPSDLVDVGVVETVVRNAICLTSSNFNITKMLTGSSGNLPPRTAGEKPVTPGNLSPRTEAVFEPIEVKEMQQSAFHAPSLASAPMMSSAPRPSRPAPGDKRLLVKVIKASALGGRDVGSIDPTCVVVMDSPPQSQATSVVKSTVNPFWDEQFLFDVTGNTKEVKFEVVDRKKPAGENFLGEAYAYYEDLKRTPSSRQIIPLQGNPAIGGDMVTGSITVEFLFLDPAEAESVRQTIAAMSPKRTVQVNQAKTPGGTLVTKTTTTTERSGHGRQDALVDGSPNYIEKHTNMYDYDGSDSTSHTSPNVLQDRSVSSSSDRKSYGSYHGQASAKPSEEKSEPPSNITDIEPEPSAEVKITDIEPEPSAEVKRTETQPEPSALEDTSASSNPLTTQSSPTEEVNNEVPTVKMDPPAPGHEEREKKKGSSLARTIKKRFSRSKKRSKSAERSRDDSHLHPPDKSYGPTQSKDDIELVRAQPETPSLKKSRSLGGSLKKLFRRGRKRSRDHGETSRDSSYSRSSTRNASQGPSREGSITRGGGAQSSSLTRSGQLPDQKGDIGRGHWSKSTPSEYTEREVDVSPRHQPSGSPTYPTLQQEPTVLQPRGYQDPQMEIGRGHWSRPTSGEQMDVVRPTYDTNSAPPEPAVPSEDVRRGHWSKSKSPVRSGGVIITTPKREPLDVVTASYDTMAAPPDKTRSSEQIDTDAASPDIQADESVRRGHWSKSKSPGRSGAVIITTPKPAPSEVVTPSQDKDKTKDQVDTVATEDVVRRGHWSKSKSPGRSGPVIITTSKKEPVDVVTTPKQEPVDVVTTPKLEPVDTVTQSNDVTASPPETPSSEVITPTDEEVDVCRGHWSKSKPGQQTRIGQVIMSKEPMPATTDSMEIDIRKGHWTKSKSPKRGSSGGVIVEVSSPPQESKPSSPPEDIVKPKAESSEKDKIKSKPAKVEPVKSRVVKVVPIKPKPEKTEPVISEPVQMLPEEPVLPPPADARRGHWSKSAVEKQEQPVGGGMIVISTEPSTKPPAPVEPADVRRGHWTKPKSKTS